MYFQRRDFLWLLGGGIVCCKLEEPLPPAPPAIDAAIDPPPNVDACTPATVLMHDTNAQALYLDGSLGPLTGVVTVAYVVARATVTLDFWHGHDGVLHRWTLEPMHLAALERGERVTLTTTVVDGHAHTLFVDPLDESYRVDGAPDVPVPLGSC
jgi:hypothetical protein